MKSRLIYMSFAVFALFACSISYAKINPDSVAGFWLCNEGKGNLLEDASGNGHDGNIAGAVEWIKGPFGEAIDLTGGSITVPDHEVFNFDESSFTVMLWVNFSQAQDWNRIFRERTPGPWGNGNDGWELQTQGVQIHWSLDDAAGNALRTTYPDVGDGEWHHTVMIVDRDENMLYSYLDGENEMSVNIAAMGSVTNANPLIFGENYQGAIDEAAIFKGVMDLDDITEIMNIGLSEAIYKGAAVSPISSSATTWANIKCALD
jgi:hypothetical protein